MAGAEVADLLLHLRKDDRVLLCRALPRSVASDAFAQLDLGQQDELLRDLHDEETRPLLTEMNADDRTQRLGELPGQATQRLLNLLDPSALHPLPRPGHGDDRRRVRRGSFGRQHPRDRRTVS